ncbi:TetR family transcriptional regulator C-terminal domain-containing protein [Actinoplanes sp. NPDC049596]|uniref:TetR/AcrR family transcriptional regulator n=1 Tax=unclassified Actinoplanes TaxID=2626549 RepID=UPI003445B0B0
MPRQVDHEERRRRIAEAVWRLAERSGLEEVTLRQVATEAGVPARQLQYYFGSREQLLLGALEILNADAESRASRRIGGTGDPRELVRAVLLELLPLDEHRRRQQVVHAAYFVRFLADEALAASVREGPQALEGLLAALLRQVDPGLDAEAEAALLIAVASGLQPPVLLGQYAPGQAIALIDHQLARLFAAREQP